MQNDTPAELALMSHSGATVLVVVIVVVVVVAAVVIAEAVVVVVVVAAAGRVTTQHNMHNSKLHVSSMSESLQTIPHLSRLLKIQSCGT